MFCISRLLRRNENFKDVRFYCSFSRSIPTAQTSCRIQMRVVQPTGLVPFGLAGIQYSGNKLFLVRKVHPHVLGQEIPKREVCYGVEVNLWAPSKVIGGPLDFCIGRHSHLVLLVDSSLFPLRSHDIKCELRMQRANAFGCLVVKIENCVLVASFLRIIFIVFLLSRSGDVCRDRTREQRYDYGHRTMTKHQLRTKKSELA